MIIILSISLLITIVCLIVMYVKLKRVNELVRFLDEEQHTQNKVDTFTYKINIWHYIQQ